MRPTTRSPQPSQLLLHRTPTSRAMKVTANQSPRTKAMSQQPSQTGSQSSRAMLADLVISEALAEALGRVVAEAHREFDQKIALRDAEFKAFQATMKDVVREA